MTMNLPANTQARFDARYIPEPNSGCWLWEGAPCKWGYGRMVLPTGKRGGRFIAAHRLSYVLHCGPIEPGALVCHRCDNPICVNPAHLFTGTDADNVRDRDTKGRTQRGARHTSARLTTEQVEQIKVADGSLAAIGRRFGITAQHAWGIRRGLKRRHG